MICRYLTLKCNEGNLSDKQISTPPLLILAEISSGGLFIDSFPDILVAKIYIYPIPQNDPIALYSVDYLLILQKDLEYVKSESKLINLISQ